MDLSSFSYCKIERKGTFFFAIMDKYYCFLRFFRTYVLEEPFIQIFF